MVAEPVKYLCTRYYKVNSKGLRSPIGPRVLPDSKNSSQLLFLRPSRRALFSHKQYELMVLGEHHYHDNKRSTHTLQAISTHARQTKESVMVWPRLYWGA